MKITKKSLGVIHLEIPMVETDKEGLLRGGFGVIDVPLALMGDNDNCGGNCENNRNCHTSCESNRNCHTGCEKNTNCHVVCETNLTCDTEPASEDTTATSKSLMGGVSFLF